MRSNYLKKLVLFMVMVFNLTGCFTTQISTENEQNGHVAIDKNQQLLLSIKSTRGCLYGSNYLYLENFLKTAKPQETIRWKKYSMTYTLISQSIFLDEKARPCRNYQFNASSFLPLTQSISCKETACRCTDGTWRIVS